MPEPVLETPRLLIRGFMRADLPAVHRILCEAFGESERIADPAALAERSAWLEWSMLAHEWLPRMHQPPYGDRAIVLKLTGELIGVAGFVPLLGPFDQLPILRPPGATGPSGYATPELGLFWAIDPLQQRRGYASESARALVDDAFSRLRLRRIVATTEYDNVASQAVMRKLGMTLGRNPQADPPWLQVVGVLDNPAAGQTIPPR
jgi:ribosomal-protein-alanine N-acetyltransferase